MGFYVPVNSYGHVETVSSPSHTFSSASLIKWLTSTSTNTFACNWQQFFLNQWKEENDRRNYFMINRHKSMGLAGIKLASPGSAVRHTTDCTTEHGQAWMRLEEVVSLTILTFSFSTEGEVLMYRKYSGVHNLDKLSP